MPQRDVRELSWSEEPSIERIGDRLVCSFSMRDYRKMLARIEFEACTWAVSKFAGSKEQAARALSLQRTTLVMKCGKHGIPLQKATQQRSLEERLGVGE